ncbi:Diacylglycerol pyrophosphate phosphatase 1 [Maudiozyma exigua]|uniref:Diacylglycerol pyrophosphate phosphatase 1 n=1 Tax=Maudiozyma exigua TaxID=34358 RepID=A0A9P6W6A2_MAUEX|nr:Diacylglycerol pyrophosphate phosphatase 1 [Kazachstania exigua]
MAVDRFSLGGSQRSFAYRVPKWRIPDVILLILVMILSYPVYYQEPFQRQFYLNDLTISHPYAVHQRVDDSMLFVYSFIVPLASILVVWVLLADKRHRWYLLYISLLGLLLSWFTTCLFTNYIKNWIGRLRPDFLDRCQPKPNLPLDTLLTASEACTAENKSILLDGFRTTPSGHSSESFAGLGYLYLWLCGQLLTEHIQVGIWRKYIAMLPLLGASLVALSRTQDYRHHFIDVLLGSALGYIIAHFIYRVYFPAIDSPVPFKPLLDDSAVTFDIPFDAIPQQDPDEQNDEEAQTIPTGI